MPTRLDALLRETGAQWRDHVDAAPYRTSRPVAARSWWRRRWVAVAACLVALVGLGVPAYRSVDPVPTAGGDRGADAEGACAAPYLSIAGKSRDPWWTGQRRGPEPVPTLHSGQTITLKGFAYLKGCYEYDRDRTPSPMTVTVYLKGGGQRRPLTTVTGSGGEGRFTTNVRIPQDFPTGKATLQAGPDWRWSTIKVIIANEATSRPSGRTIDSQGSPGR